MEERIQVWMADLAAMVPYYTGHLCEHLGSDRRIEARLVSIRYRHDTGFFDRLGVRRTSMFDAAYEGPGRLPVKAGEYLLNLMWLIVQAAAGRIHLLHVQFLPLLTRGFGIELWALKAFRMLGCKTVYTVHNVLPQDSGRRLHRLYQKVYNEADTLICHDSSASRRLIDEFGITADRISIIPHGPLFASERVSTTVAEARARLGFGPADRVVLWQGIVRPYKGIGFLLDVWRSVAEQEHKAVLVIAGTGDPILLDQLREAARDLPRVHLKLRFLPVPEVTELFAAADVIVYPYAEITTSGALLTAISSGRAILASDLPGFTALIRDGATGLVRTFGDRDAWVSALLRLIRDDQYREVLASELQSIRASLPQWPEIASSTIDTYLRVLGQPHGQTRTASA